MDLLSKIIVASTAVILTLTTTVGVIMAFKDFGLALEVVVVTGILLSLFFTLLKVSISIWDN